MSILIVFDDFVLTMSIEYKVSLLISPILFVLLFFPRSLMIIEEFKHLLFILFKVFILWTVFCSFCLRANSSAASCSFLRLCLVLSIKITATKAIRGTAIAQVAIAAT